MFASTNLKELAAIIKIKHTLYCDVHVSISGCVVLCYSVTDIYNIIII